jgi:aarF domain-containing kinase
MHPGFLLLACVLLSVCIARQPTAHNFAVNSNAGSSREQYSVPIELQPNNGNLRDFKAISSHGREEHNEITTPSIKSIVLRFIYLIWIFLPTFLTSLFAYMSSAFRDMIWYNLLTNSMANSGAAFVKWSQWASTRPDVFPEKLCSVLSKLQANAPIHSYAYTKYLIEKELKTPINLVFNEFNVEPIASGSIAQVYKAKLNNIEVAVKVRHPNVKENIELDFIIMKVVARYIESIPGLEWLHLSDSLTQFSATISSQTSLDVEGKHLVLFNRNFRNWKNTKFPKPYILTDSVLVESWETGVSVAKYATKNHKNKDYYNIGHFVVTRGEDIYLKMLLQDNLMHADLHPGNILVNINSNQQPESIVLVDAGMVAELKLIERQNFIGLLEAMGEGKGDEAARYVIGFSQNNLNHKNKGKFIREMKILFAETCKGYDTNVSLGNVLRGILTLVRQNQITIDANYATLVMNALCLDGMAGSLSPTYNVLDGAKSLLRLHRVFKRLPGEVSNIVMKLFLPIALKLKGKYDKKVIRNINMHN